MGVENAIKDAWPSGIQRQEEQQVLGHTVHDIKMNGNPWWTSEANVDNNRIINMIVQNLSKINLRLVGGISIKGGTDSLFFIEDPGSNAQFSSISLCQKNRLRLVDCKEESQYAAEWETLALHWCGSSSGSSAGGSNYEAMLQ